MSTETQLPLELTAKGLARSWQTMVSESDLPAAQRLALMALASFTDRDGRGNPSQPTIAERAGVSVPTVAAAVREAEARDWLFHTSRRWPGSQWRHSVYQLVIPDGVEIEKPSLDPKHWDPAVGDVLAGTFLRWEEGSNRYGTRPIAVIESDDGEATLVWVFHESLREQFDEFPPEPGDRIRITRLEDEAIDPDAGVIRWQYELEVFQEEAAA